MSSNNRPLTLRDLYRLGEQLEADRERSSAELVARDHDIGRKNPAQDASGSLVYWLDHVRPDDEQASWRDESQAVVLLRLAALLLGGLAVGGFMLASDRALVNALLFQLLFVLLPLFFSAIAAVVLLRSMRGRPPAVSPLNPTRLIGRRSPPASGELREATAALRLLLLKYGQELSLLFAGGIFTGFLLLLAFTDFSFVWGSTFGVSDRAVAAFNAILALPWSAWLPQAEVTADVVSATRYHAAQLNLDGVNSASRRGWWSFLAMCLLVYGMLPRLFLLLLSRRAYRVELARSFITFPGAAAVLARMRSPVVNTRAREHAHVDALQPAMNSTEAATLLEWAGALANLDIAGLALSAPGEHLRAGLGSPLDDVACIEEINRRRPQLLRVAVKSWEPPMADLADVLAEIEVPHCVLQLVPLAGRTVSESSLRDWESFAAELSFSRSEVEALVVSV